MKKFKFELEKVLNIRQKELDSISQEVADCLYRVKLKENEVNILNQELIMIQEERTTKLSLAISSKDLKQMIFKEESVQMKLKTTTLELNELHEQSKRLLIKRQNKKIEVNSLEKLRERQKNEYDLNASKQEEAFIESLWNMKEGSKQ
jgi:flagellar FliJ protein